MSNNSVFNFCTPRILEQLIQVDSVCDDESR